MVAPENVARVLPAIATALVLLLANIPAAAGTPTPTKYWAATWASSPMSRPTLSPGTSLPETFEKQTLRQRVRISLGGTQLRVRISNEFGATPMVIGAATMALAGTDSALQPGTLRTLTFGGSTSVTIPAGAPALSDPVNLEVKELAELNISLFLPQPTRADTLHPYEDRPAYIASGGDLTARGELTGAGAAVPATALARFYLTGVEVCCSKPAATVVAFGDSTTEGGRADNGWPSAFARRVARHDAKTPAIAIVNAGIAGNRLLDEAIGPNAQARFDRDALAVSGVTHVVVLEGINDLGFFDIKPFPLRTPAQLTARDLIGAYQQLIARAHQRGIRIIGATIMPFTGFDWLAGYFTPGKEPIRQEVNHWIRSSGAFDGVIDFEAAMRDPADPVRLRKNVDSGDHLHPSDAGMIVMAESIDLGLFARPAQTR